MGKGHHYLTILLKLNMFTGAILFVGKGKGADALQPSLQKLKSARAQIKAVEADMSTAYI